jgi:hypothetical protein
MKLDSNLYLITKSKLSYFIFALSNYENAHFTPIVHNIHWLIHV